MALARYLVDKSALARLGHTAVKQQVRPLIRRGLTGMCGMVALELLFSSRSAEEHERIREALREREWLHTEDEDFLRAIEVQAELAKSAKHRTVALPDLVIAAVAERHRVTVLHYDADFDLIAEVTGQPMEWVVERGSLN